MIKCFESGRNLSLKEMETRINILRERMKSRKVRKEPLSERDGNSCTSSVPIGNSLLRSGRNLSLKEMETVLNTIKKL